MSAESDQPEADAVDEALARAEFPVRYAGEVDGHQIELLATMAQDGPLLRISALERTGPYENLRPASTYAIGAGSALEAADTAKTLAKRHDLEVVEE